MEKGINPLYRFHQQWQRLCWLQIGLWLLTGACFGFTLAAFLLGSQHWGTVVVSVVSSGMAGIAFRPKQRTKQYIAEYINIQVPDLQDSAQLLLKSSQELSVIESWQQRKVAQKAGGLIRNVKIPNQLPKAIGALALGVTMATLVSLQSPIYSTASSRSPNSTITQDEVSPILPIGVAAMEVTITAPGYSQISARTTQNFNIQALEQSMATWTLQFSSEPQQVVMVWGEGDTLNFSGNDKTFVLKRRLTQASYYSLAWQGHTGVWEYSDFFGIDVVSDQPPVVRVLDREPYVRMPHQPNISVPLTLAFEDDFDITQAYLVATVAQGEGESVRFREVELAIPHAWDAFRKQETVSYSLSLNELQMVPGDELYFFVVAQDNRTPTAQSGRSEMYFITLEDSTRQVIQMEGGLGVDLMPDYFRSQRQLIIDTEQLLADQASGRMPTDTFKSLSNALGYDQKALRLKYGALLGLEDENGSGIPENVAPEASMEGYLQHEENEEFRDDSHEHGDHHDEEEEEHEGSVFSQLLAEGFGEEHDHDHDHDHGEEGDENPLLAYMHVHDDSEEATFYAEGLKAKLRYALEQMWDAELHLRLYEPKKSLPYQYAALKMINEIRLDARIYVERVGFEPPPLKEHEVRLTGKQENITGFSNRLGLTQAPLYPTLSAILPLLENWRKAPVLPNELERELLRRAGQTIAGLALERPGELLVPLTLLKNLTQGELSAGKIAQSAAELETAILTILPAARPKVSLQRARETTLESEWRRASNQLTP